MDFVSVLIYSILENIFYQRIYFTREETETEIKSIEFQIPAAKAATAWSCWSQCSTMSNGWTKGSSCIRYFFIWKVELESLPLETWSWTCTMVLNHSIVGPMVNNHRKPSLPMVAWPKNYRSQCLQWCPEKIIIPSHRWKKMTIVQVCMVIS